MLLSELLSGYGKEESVLIRDCSFDVFYLIGKVKPKGEKLITFVEDLKYVTDNIKNDMSGIICTEEIAQNISDDFMGGILVTKNPRTFFFRLYNYSVEIRKKENQKTHIGKNVKIHETAIIPENNVYIGDNTIIGPYTIITENVHIGNNVFIEANCRIGSEAFYHIYSDDEHIFIKSSGSVFIDDNSAIHSGTSIEKGALGGETFIGKDVAIDNNVLIGHDAKIEDLVRIAGGTSTAGGVHIGKKAQLGLGVITAPNVSIGENARVSVGAIITKDVPPEVRYSGNFAIEHSIFLKNLKKQLKEVNN